MKRRATAPGPARSRPPAASGGNGDQVVHPAGAAGKAEDDHAGGGPVIVLSYAHSGAQRVQEILADGTGLACTFGTGVIPQCAAAAEAWRQVEGRDGHLMSRLAVSTVRGLVTAQVTVILASAGQARWCELATATPQALQPFLQIFPDAAVLCVHRRCPDVISAMVQASPWGLPSPALRPYLLSHPGNNVAAIAAYWANQTDDLLAFERANPASTRRIRLEDVAAGEATLTAVRDWLKLSGSRSAARPREPGAPQPGPHPPPPPAEIPVRLIPAALHERINRLHAELGYPPVPAAPAG
jgi:hypothetical protein